jgi:hypothetical protein
MYYKQLDKHIFKKDLNSSNVLQMKVLLYQPIQNDYINNTLEVCRHLNWIEMGCGCKCKKFIVMIMKFIHSSVNGI